MVAMIERLIEHGNAYEARGPRAVLRPERSRLRRAQQRDRDAMVAGARVEVAPYKRDPADFVLWKPSGGRRDRLGFARGAAAGRAGTSNARR